MHTTRQRLARLARTALSDLEIGCTVSNVHEVQHEPTVYSIRILDAHADHGPQYFWIDLVWTEDTPEAMRALRQQLVTRVIPFLRRPLPPSDGSPGERYLAAVRAAAEATKARSDHETLLRGRQA